ncbi:MAG: VOC family protein [Deltaproteobacteria bacterium]|nr:VOC family protein [Deltaproteobacteria bacterium]
MNIYRIDHICQVVPDLNHQLKLLEGLFGFRKSQEWEKPDEGSRGVLLEVPGSWGHRWEVQEPLGKQSPLQEFLDSPAGPGIHHLAVEVTDLDVALKRVSELGIHAGRLSTGPSKRFVDVPFVPPERESGLLWRLFGPSSAGICCSGGSAVPAKATAPSEPTLGIVAIEQVGHACENRDELAQWCEKAAGMQEVYRTPEGKHPDIKTLVLTIPGTQMRWELIQPVDEESFVHRFLKNRGHQAHHVTFEVADWDKALAACEHHGIPTFGANDGVTDGGRWADTFIHPKHAGGFLVQFFWEELPGVWSRSDKIAWKAKQTA